MLKGNLTSSNYISDWLKKMQKSKIERKYSLRKVFIFDGFVLFYEIYCNRLKNEKNIFGKRLMYWHF